MATNAGFRLALQEEGKVVSAAQASRRGFRHHLGGGRYLSMILAVKNSDTVIIRKLVITFECDTIIISIVPAEEGNNELLLPWSFLETGSDGGCYRL